MGYAASGAARYPSVAAYEAALPFGWASFPECKARAELIRSLHDRGALSGLTGLPGPLQQLLEAPSSTAEWFPEIMHVGALLGLRDKLFPGTAAGASGLLAWVDKLNRDLMADPQHSDLFPASVNHPADFVARLPQVWARFREGTSLTVESASDERAEIVHTHPRQIYPDLMHESHRRAIVAGLARCGAVQPVVDVRPDRGPDLARTTFVASWRSA